ncbi:MAG TPA: hypothetical protein VFH54_16980 [Mycobacteriales bacterium]|nr:hypothetical protein [Mycobacteriales bacterium]
MAQSRIELGTQYVVGLSRGDAITVMAIDEENARSEDWIEVTVALLDRCFNWFTPVFGVLALFSMALLAASLGRWSPEQRVARTDTLDG